MLLYSQLIRKRHYLQSLPPLFCINLTCGKTQKTVDGKIGADQGQEKTTHKDAPEGGGKDFHSHQLRQIDVHVPNGIDAATNTAAGDEG